ncbi:MAG: sodium ion-translocating decarboxylase subunit beta, partial [Candidatus Alkaliphilus sp. MAG34]
MVDIIVDFLRNIGFASLTVGQLLMIGISCLLLYLAIKKGFEPLLLVPIAFGMLLANLPLAGIMDAGTADSPGGL